jgi:hypothetical protein
MPMTSIYMTSNAYGPKYDLRQGQVYLLDSVLDAALITELTTPHPVLGYAAATTVIPPYLVPTDSGLNGS